MPDAAISIHVNTRPAASGQPKPSFHAIVADASAVRSSTSGYCQEMATPQYRHRPRSKTQLASGMLSNAESLCLQEGQCEPVLTRSGGTASSVCSCPSSSRACERQSCSSLFGRRRMTTLRKLPTRSPSNPVSAISGPGSVAQASSDTRGLADHRGELEDREVHADHHAADEHADDDHDERFEEARQRIDRVVDLFLEKLGDLEQHLVERAGLLA